MRIVAGYHPKGAKLSNLTHAYIIVPDLGETVRDAILTQWLVAPFDVVAIGDPVAEVESEKVNIEVPAETGGVLVRQLAVVGDRVAVGQRIAEIVPQEP